jgi:DNA mismatch repair protein Mlh1 C-terminus
MLAEYFSLNITASGLVESLPLLLRDYTPNLDNLPGFLMRLGPQVSPVPLFFNDHYSCETADRWTGLPSRSASSLFSENLLVFMRLELR